MSKLVGDTASILAYLFHSASRQCHKIRTLHFLFLYNFKDTVPPSEACLCGCTNWSLAQAQQQPYLGLSNFFYLCEEWQKRNQPKASFQFNIQNLPCQTLVDGPWQERLTWKLELKVIKIVGNHLVMHLAVPTILEREANGGTAFLIDCCLQLHQPAPLSIV